MRIKIYKQKNNKFIFIRFILYILLDINLINFIKTLYIKIESY
jgi:hypothetical protein